MKFIPAVYEHAAKVIGKTPWEVSRNKALIIEAHRAAFAMYSHTPVVVGIDIYNLEPEAYGAPDCRARRGRDSRSGMSPVRRNLRHSGSA